MLEQGQFDIWEAVYSPQGEDGYPKRLFDKKCAENRGDSVKCIAEYKRDKNKICQITNKLCVRSSNLLMNTQKNITQDKYQE